MEKFDLTLFAGHLQLRNCMRLRPETKLIRKQLRGFLNISVNFQPLLLVFHVSTQDWLSRGARAAAACVALACARGFSDTNCRCYWSASNATWYVDFLLAYG